MPLYTYRALSENGVFFQGEVMAASQAEVAKHLADRGLLLQATQRARSRFFLSKRQGIRNEEFFLFNQEMIAILGAGLTLTEALKLVSDRRQQPMFAQVLSRVLDQVRAGLSFSDACAEHPEVFDRLYLAALRTGEKTGALVAVLKGYQESLKTKLEFEKKVAHALAYPLFLLLTLGSILIVLFVFVMPKFVSMYAEFDATLPLPTRILMGFVRHLPVIAVPLVGTVALLWFMGNRWFATESGSLAIARLRMRLPLVGDFYHQLAIARFARTLATLLSGGTPLIEALHATQYSLVSRLHALQVEEATVMVEQGRSLADALGASGLMPGIPLKMLEAGEASGALDAMLVHIAQYYEEQLSGRLSRITVLIEPLLMLLMGIFIGGIIIIMYLPIFYMAAIVR